MEIQRGYRFYEISDEYIDPASEDWLSVHIEGQQHSYEPRN